MSEKYIFISYSSKDKEITDKVVGSIENAGFKCWIAPRDISPGVLFAESIVNAISSASLFVIVFSKHSDQSQQVLKEVDRAVNINIPIIPFRIEPLMPSKSMEYYLCNTHWLDAFDINNGIKKIIMACKEKLSGEKLNLTHDKMEIEHQLSKSRFKSEELDSDKTITMQVDIPPEIINIRQVNKTLKVDKKIKNDRRKESTLRPKSTKVKSNRTYLNLLIVLVLFFVVALLWSNFKPQNLPKEVLIPAKSNVEKEEVSGLELINNYNTSVELIDFRKQILLENGIMLNESGKARSKYQYFLEIIKSNLNQEISEETFNLLASIDFKLSLLMVMGGKIESSIEDEVVLDYDFVFSNKDFIKNQQDVLNVWLFTTLLKHSLITDDKINAFSTSSYPLEQISVAKKNKLVDVVGGDLLIIFRENKRLNMEFIIRYPQVISSETNKKSVKLARTVYQQMSNSEHLKDYLVKFKEDDSLSFDLPTVIIETNFFNELNILSLPDRVDVFIKLESIFLNSLNKYTSKY